MSKKPKFLKSHSVGGIIITACVAIVVVLVVSLLLATFTSFKTGISGAVNTQTRELSTQIVFNYENYINSIIETSNIIQTDIDRYDLTDETDAQAFSEYLQEIVHLNSGILQIGVYNYDQCRCIASSNAYELDFTYDKSVAWYAEAIADPTVHVFSVPYSESSTGEYRMNISKRIKIQNGAASAVLKIETSFQQFIALVEKSNLGDGGHVTIIDPNYDIVYSSLGFYGTVGATGSVIAEEIGIFKDIVLGSKNVVLGDHNMTVNVDTLSNTKWRICVFINIDRLAEIEWNFLLTIILVSGVVLFIAVLLFTGVARAITSPIKKLELAMRKVEKSDYFRMEEVDISASREVEALSLRFNKMMHKINELMERVITEQDAQRKSELKALQNQINPHFLYNTLDSIVWLIENKKNEEAEEMVVALARLFRIGISKETEVIPVREELEHVRNYLLIQSIRYADSFDYEFRVDDGVLELETLKLILQPVVENSIYHGLKNKIDKGRITITVHIVDGYLELSVADNGYGMRQQTIDKLYESFKDGAVSNSVGLKNIYQRVMIYYGGDAEMRIESELDEGTTITIREPLNKK